MLKQKVVEMLQDESFVDFVNRVTDVVNSLPNAGFPQYIHDVAIIMYEAEDYKDECTKSKSIEAHILKTHPHYFCEVLNGNKTFEVRRNDRNYKVGDIVILWEYIPSTNRYTSRQIEKRISYILDNPNFCKEGYVILGISDTLNN